MAYFETKGLTVGYNGKPLIRDIDISLEKGAVLTLIGPNGAGKSTILKTITRRLERLGGGVYIDGRELRDWGRKELARTMSVVLTERIRPELMTCADVVAMGRYPYTNLLGRLTEADIEIARGALERVHALDLAEQDFSTLSDGQKQRILLARAICQEPEILVLDEPTAYLDIRHKIELLGILRQMSREKDVTVIMSLHEIDLAMKVSDELLCVKGAVIAASGAPEELLRQHSVEELYDMEAGAYDPLFGSVELDRPSGDPRVFVVAGGGFGAPVYRSLQKRQVPFAAGILYENDVDCHVARMLSTGLVSAPAFRPMTDAQFEEAAALMRKCGAVIDAGTPGGELNRPNEELLALARREDIPLFTSVEAWGAGHG